MFEIIIREIRDRKISIIAYSLGAFLMLWLYVGLFPSIQASSAELQKLMDAYPEAIYKAFGIDDLSFNTLEKFIGMEQFSFVWPIIALFLVVSRAGSSIAGEIEKGVIGLYLALPLKRLKIAGSKYISALITILVFVVVTILTIIPLAALHNIDVDSSKIFSLALVSFMFLWAIYAVSFCLSTFFSERSKVYMITGGGLVIMYVMNVISELKPNLDWLHNFSIFYYYNAQDILANGTMQLSSYLVFGTVILLFSVLGFVIFQRRDISV